VSIDGIIFDLDGTLVDSLDDLADSVNTVLIARGFDPHPRDAYRAFVGNGIAELVRRAVGAAGSDTALLEACVTAVRAEYESRWDRKTCPYPGIAETLATLRGYGIALAVLSNKPHPLTVRVVDRYFGSDAFRAVLGAEVGYERKPDPAGALAIAESIGIAPPRWLYVGDSATDILTALAADMMPIGVLWGFRDARELAAAGALRLVREPIEICAYARPTP
jgi:phosphoglycolate phosphatase